MSTTFRTRTGQTGTDAYLYEAAQIANELRELNARAARLAAAMVAELPADASCNVSIASDRFPDATRPIDRDGLARVLPMFGEASYMPQLASYARAIGDSDHVADNRAETMAAPRPFGGYVKGDHVTVSTRVDHYAGETGTVVYVSERDARGRRFYGVDLGGGRIADFVSGELFRATNFRADH